MSSQAGDFDIRALFRSLGAWFRQAPGAKPASKIETSEQEPACCSNAVHIAFRGVSDERMYVSYNRDWADVRYFKAHGLRVFCAECRRRLL